MPGDEQRAEIQPCSRVSHSKSIYFIWNYVFVRASNTSTRSSCLCGLAPYILWRRKREPSPRIQTHSRGHMQLYGRRARGYTRVSGAMNMYTLIRGTNWIICKTREFPPSRSLSGSHLYAGRVSHSSVSRSGLFAFSPVSCAFRRVKRSLREKSRNDIPFSLSVGALECIDIDNASENASPTIAGSSESAPNAESYAWNEKHSSPLCK